MKMRRGRSRFAVRVFLYFLFLSLLATIVTAGISYRTAAKLLEDNTYTLVSDTISKFRYYLNDKLAIVTAQYEMLESNPALLRLMMRDYGKHSRASYYDDMKDVLEQFHLVSDNYPDLVDSIYFYDRNNDVELYSIKNRIYNRLSGKEELWKQLEQEDLSLKSNALTWMNLHEEQIFSTIPSRNVVSVYRRRGSDETKVAYVLVMNIKENMFKEIMDDVGLGASGYMMIIGSDTIMYSDNYSDTFALSPESRNQLRAHAGQSSGFLELDTAGGATAVAASVRLSNGWVVAAVMLEKDILAQTGQIGRSTILVVLAISSLCAAAAFLISRNVTMPVKELVQQIGKVEHGDLDVDFAIHSDAEFQMLSIGLDHLLMKVKQLLRDIEHKEKEKRIQEMAALQAQMSPHFLYNTLSSVRTLVDFGEQEKATHMIDMLILFFHTGLSKGRTKITLEEEMNHVSSYLEIQKIRYSKKFEYEIDIEPGLEQASIIKFTVQPLVENSLYHGLRESDEDGLILVSAEREGDELIVKVFDNGIGMMPEKLQQLQSQLEEVGTAEAATQIESNDKFRSFGLASVHRRIILRYGKHYGVVVESVYGEWTQIIMRLPFLL